MVEYRESPKYPGYSVGDDGSVWSRKVAGSKKGRMSDWRQMRPHRTKWGYRQVMFLVQGRRYFLYVHRLVLTAFVGKCPPGMEACHNDGNKDNNRLSNLRWDTPVGNHADKLKHGTHHRGERCPTGRLTESQVAAIVRLIDEKKLSQTEIGAIYGVRQITISNINCGKRWGWFTKRGKWADSTLAPPEEK